MVTVTHTPALIKLAAGPKKLDYLPINRNLRNYPIARGERVTLKWRKSKKHAGRWYYRLPGVVTVYLPVDIHHATGFDFAMLLMLTGLAIARGNCELTLTNQQILHHMGVKEQAGGNRSKVGVALAFWQCARLTWPRWYTPPPASPKGKGKGKPKDRGKGTYGKLTVERPILKASRGCVVLNPEWVKLAGSFFVQLPTPLPTEAPVLNLLLLVTGWLRGYKETADGWVEKRFRSRREVTARIGLDHNAKRNSQLTSTIGKLKRWFLDHGSELQSSGADSEGEMVFKYETSITATRVKGKVGGSSQADEDDSHTYDDEFDAYERMADAHNEHTNYDD